MLLYAVIELEHPIMELVWQAGHDPWQTSRLYGRLTIKWRTSTSLCFVQKSSLARCRLCHLPWKTLLLNLWTQPMARWHWARFSLLRTFHQYDGRVHLFIHNISRLFGFTFLQTYTYFLHRSSNDALLMKLGVGLLWLGKLCLSTRRSSCVIHTQGCGLLASFFHGLGCILVPGPALLPAVCTP